MAVPVDAGDVTMKGELSSGYLTPAELVILRHIALGHQNKGMAQLLGVTIKTIQKHRNNLCRKLDCHCPADLARTAIELGVIHVIITPLQRVTGQYPQSRERWLIPQLQRALFAV